VTEQELNLLKLPAGFMTPAGAGPSQIVRSNVVNARFQRTPFQNTQITFELKPVFPMRWALLMALNIGPVVTPAAVNQSSTATLTQLGDYPMLFSLL